MLLHRALRLMRVYYDMTQASLAEKLGVTKSYISEIEAGNKTPSMEVLSMYAKVFDVPLSSILFFAEHIQFPSKASKSRNMIAGKILNLLDFVADKAKAGGGNE